MNSLQLRTAFRRLFAQWYLLGLAARCLQFTLIFEAVSHGVGAAWMGAVMAASSVACAVFTIYAGRLYNRFGPSPLNRCAALCCAGAGFLATQHEAPAALAVAWMLTGMTLMLAATAGYRGIGGLFGAADRVSRFSRMCLLSNVSEIAMPVAIGALFSQAPDLMPFIVLAVSLALSFLSSGVSRSDLRVPDTFSFDGDQPCVVPFCCFSALASSSRVPRRAICTPTSSATSATVIGAFPSGRSSPAAKDA